VSADPKEIQDGAVNGKEALRVSRGLEAAHEAFSESRGLVRDFRPIVRVLGGAVPDGRDGSAVGGGVAAQFVGDQSGRHAALPFQ